MLSMSNDPISTHGYGWLFIPVLHSQQFELFQCIWSVRDSIPSLASFGRFKLLTNQNADFYSSNTRSNYVYVTSMLNKLPKAKLNFTAEMHLPLLKVNWSLASPQLYVQHNKAQRHSVQQLLDEYIHLVRWKPDADDSVMEVGCGPGDITTEILLPKLPKSLRELVATDLSPQMIQYARNHHQHPLVSYDILDISTKTLPGMYHGRFDHVFSFYCLHWVQDQR